MTLSNPGIPLDPPREWFTPPDSMEKNAGCVVESNGRIYGYICHWQSVLMDGTNDRWTPPRSKTGYAYAHTGDTVCADGSTVKTANLGGDAGHAKSDPYDTERLTSLQAFYEDTSTQLARVVYGEDANGVWFAGACWPTVTDLDIAKLRASARSGHWAAIGDWRDISSGRAGYELVGACLVNVPGLKYARADKAASGVLTLRPICSMRDSNAVIQQIGDLVKQLEWIATPELHSERVASSGTIQLATTTNEGIPVSGVLVIENQQTEDGRFIDSGAITWRDLPLPLYAKLENTEGHTDAKLVGRIDSIERSADDPNVVLYEGEIVPETADGYGQRVLEAINSKMLMGVSIDGAGGPDDAYVDDSEVLHMTKLVIVGATLTPMPAMSEASVTIGLTSERDSMTDETFNDELADAPADTSTDTPVEDTEDMVDTGDVAVSDQITALSDAVASVSDRVEYLISIVEATQMNARLDAIQRREATGS